MSNKAVTSYRVSFFDTYVIVGYWPDRPELPPFWSVWDESGVLPHCLDSGRGEPPARHFPTGIVPDWRKDIAS